MLRDSTNPIEVKMYPFIKTYFQNYEVFWDNFLIDGIGVDIHWKQGPFEQLGISNYGILKSLNFVRINYDKISVNDENQTFKNIYYHFGIICELIPYCCRYIYEFLNNVGLRNNEFVFQNDTISDKMINAMLSHFIIDELVLKNCAEFYKSITCYRHFFTHNPGIDIVNSNGKMRVIGRENIDFSRKLSSLRNAYNTTPELSVNPISQAYVDFIKMLEVLNLIWGYFIIEMEKAKNDKKETYYNLLEIR